MKSARTAARALTASALAAMVVLTGCSAAKTGEPAPQSSGGDHELHLPGGIIPVRVRERCAVRSRCHRRPPDHPGLRGRGQDQLRLHLRHRRQPSDRHRQRVRAARQPARGRLAGHRLRSRHRRDPLRLCAVVVAVVVRCGRCDPGLVVARLCAGGARLSGTGLHYRLPPVPRCHHRGLQHDRRRPGRPETPARRLGQVGGFRGVAGRSGVLGRQRTERRVLQPGPQPGRFGQCVTGGRFLRAGRPRDGRGR